MRRNNKITMAWCIFAVWASTVFLTIVIGRDVATLALVSATFGTVVIWFFQIREREKKDGIE